MNLPFPIELNIEGPAMLNQLSFRLGSSNWFLGMHQLYSGITTGLAKSSEDEQLAQLGQIPAAGDFFDFNFGQRVTTSGLGVVAEYDSRNNPLNPEQGYSCKFKYLWFDDAIGSDVDYRDYNITGLNYWSFADKFVLGLRLQYDSVSSSDDTRLPAYVPPYIELRGIPAGRYQGNNVAVTEVQFDYKLTFRWKLSAFMGGGRAAQTFSALNDAATEVGKGIGFRYQVARRYGFEMGIDVAKGPEDTAFYIQAGSPL